MIKELEIHNFKSLGKIELKNLDSLVVFTGLNGSGKSNILDALYFVSQSMRMGLEGAITDRQGIKIIRRWSSGKPVDIYFRIKIDCGTWNGQYAFRISSHKTYDYSIKQEVAIINVPSKNLTANLQRENGHWRTKPKGLDPKINEMGLALPLISADSRFELLYNFLSNMVVYNIYPDQLRELHKYSPAKPLDKHGGNWVSILKDMDERDWRTELILALQKLTGEIDDVKISQIRGFLSMDFRHGKTGTEVEKGRWFGPYSESDGTLRLAGIVTAVLQKPILSVIGIEEPELTVHPAAIKIIYDFIKQGKSQSQVFITTHSPELLDLVENPSAVKVVTRVNDTTEVDDIAEDQIQTVQNHLRTLGDIHRTEGLIQKGAQIELSFE
jgi:predicted ATPase